jgi:hypothetical protein
MVSVFAPPAASVRGAIRRYGYLSRRFHRKEYRNNHDDRAARLSGVSLLPLVLS